MNIDRYLVFSSTAAASNFFDQLQAAMRHREVWGSVNEHPFDKRAIVPWSDHYLAQYGHLIEDIEQISQEQAEQQGFLFGRLKGPFAHARAKLEEAQLLQQALEHASLIPNFSVYRALFIGFLSATFALKEALRKSCKILGGDAEDWFENQFQLLKEDPVVWAFFQLNNAIKHSHDELPLRSSLQTHSLRTTSGPPSLQLVTSDEGIIGILDANTSKERVISLANVADVSWQVNINMPNCGISGPLKPMTKHVLRFYELLVFEARRTFGGEKNLQP